MKKGFLVLESGEVFEGEWLGGRDRCGEVVFNTSHCGFEEMATDPSYFKQILVCTASQQGNYGAHKHFWESEKIHIEGFVCLEMQNSKRENSWVKTLLDYNVPILHKLDTRKITLTLRKNGTTWGSLVQAESKQQAIEISKNLIEQGKKIDSDWPAQVSSQKIQTLKGHVTQGIRFALLDYGVKKNIIRELLPYIQEITVFPCTTQADEILKDNFDALILSNGPGDPALVRGAVETIRQCLGKLPILGICMGHQLLSIALGASTYKLKFGHRGANHPIHDRLTNKIYMTSQNHGYAVQRESLPSGVEETHTNLYDKTVSGIFSAKYKAYSVQYHPEHSPGPHDGNYIFKYFINSIQEKRG